MISNDLTEDDGTAPGPGVVVAELGQDVLDDVVRRIETARLHRSAGELAAKIEQLLKSSELPGMAFDEHRAGRSEQAVVVPAIAGDRELWFVGDVHGDLLALECAVQYIRAFDSSRPATIVFLGDLIDDGRDGFEVVLRVFEMLVDDPAGTCFVAGNHDEALARLDEGFYSSVSPAEFADWLSANASQPDVARIGELAIELVALAPRALFLPDGLLAAHGGIPHSDLWDALTTRDAFNAPQCLTDFVWTRAHERARSRVPNRTSRGCEFGYEDFSNFCRIASHAIGQPVERMIRGHDHVELRYAVFERYGNNMLTINCLSHRLSREYAGPYERTPCVARWIPGKLPEVHRLVIPSDLIQCVYPEKAADAADQAKEGIPSA